MANHKAGRLAEDIKRIVSAHMRELSDPRVDGMKLTIMRCEVTSDLSHCKIYVSNLEGFERAKESVKGLESASGLFKREISNILHIRRCPELKFVADDSLEHSDKINRILKQISKERKDGDEE